jgi:hypothetical protein
MIGAFYAGSVDGRRRGASGATYEERLRVPLRWWVQGTMLVASLWLAVVVALPGAAAWAVTAVAGALTAALLLGYGAARVRVVDGVLQAGRARIGLGHLGPARALSVEEAHRAAGREADARAYHLLRPYLKRAVRVEVADPRDPTPYWLLGTRHPDRLVSALSGVAEPPSRAARVDAPHRQED